MQRTRALPGRFKGYAVVRDKYGRIKVDDWDSLDPGFRNHLLQLWAQGAKFANAPPKHVIGAE